MVKKLSNEQLSRLVMHTTGINNVLLEAMLIPRRHESDFDEPHSATEPEESIEILVVESAGKCQAARTEEPLPHYMDALCGLWTGGKKKPELEIFLADPGYMAAFGKPDKKTGMQDCFLIRMVEGRLQVYCEGRPVYLSYEVSKDILTLWPGGEYARVPEKK